MNPVTAGMCSDPAEYPWSSCFSKVADMLTWREQAQNLYQWLDSDPLYLDMGKTKHERQQHYREFLTEAVSDKERELIRLAVQRGQLTGEVAFIDEIETKLQRRIEFRQQSRPKKLDLTHSEDKPKSSPLKKGNK